MPKTCNFQWDDIEEEGKQEKEDHQGEDGSHDQHRGMSWLLRTGSTAIVDTKVDSK
jgi:hypothetical protein